MTIEKHKELIRLWILVGWNKNRNEQVIEQVFAQNDVNNLLRLFHCGAAQSRSAGRSPAEGSYDRSLD